MAGSGRWSLQLARRNCGRCRVCMDDPQNRPHGPYAYLRRRNPADSGRKGKQDGVYLGRVELNEGQLALINERFLGPVVPSREEILAIVA